MLWQASVSAQRRTPRAEVAAPICGRPFGLYGSEIHNSRQGRWRG
jgi:hypothetical protein